ncbi:MAG TPA: hypothetical protein VG125_33905, partial [Pirellulales bacterium]|nr:hypothetical protein [Pirellulales bacterium]
LLSVVSGCLQSSQGTATAGKPPLLPDLSVFRERPSDRFLVDFNAISSGHPFKGIRSTQPHAGCHIHFDNSNKRWPVGSDEPAGYPAVYAVADGTISRVDFRFGQRGGNDRYGLDLSFAVDAEGKTCHLCYSIEPMIPEPEKDFYRRFLRVKAGDKVHEGDVIAYMYTPRGVRDAHIHFHMRIDGRQEFLAPAVFTSEVVRQFHARWGSFGLDGDTRMPPCIGYRLDARENPFGTGPADQL